MKKLPLFCAFLSFQAAVLYGQTLTGTWQGVLKRRDAPNGEQRIVIKVSTTEADKLAATMYFINEGATTLVPSSAVTANGTGLKMSFERINGAWEGRLSADSKTLDGAWTQDEPRPLVLSRATAETAWTIPDPPPLRQMMDPKAAPGFEVATIKPSNPDKLGFQRIGVDRSGTITTLNTTLLYLVKFAYGLHPKQVVGAPAWIDADKFDITAKPDIPGSPTFAQIQSILQKLLAERFGLVFHKEKRELSAYAITVAKGGEKIKKDEDTAEPSPSFGGPPSAFVVRNATMAEFTTFFLVKQFIDQPVVDHTGFGETRYSFILKFMPEPGMLAPGAGPDAQPPAPNADAPPGIFAAMQQQLGLHIQKTKAQVDVMVIDKVSKPSEN
jgi:uncharacterized protein (TIGR03435 family)